MKKPTKNPEVTRAAIEDWLPQLVIGKVVERREREGREEGGGGEREEGGERE